MAGVQISTPATEKFLVGKSLLDQQTLTGALQQLSGEISPNTFPASASAEYRKILALGLFYKVHLGDGQPVKPMTHSLSMLAVFLVSSWRESKCSCEVGC